MKKEIIQATLSIIVMIIGIYMMVTNSFPSPPAISGLGFLLAGLTQWLNYCPICKAICKGK